MSARKNPLFLISTSIAVLFFAILVFGISGDKGETGAPKSEQIASCRVDSFSYLFDPADKLAYFEGKQFTAPGIIPAYLAQGKNVLGVASSNEKWVEVDISDQKLIAREGDSIFLESAVSTGLPGYDTPFGEFKVWYKTKSQKMSGGQGASYYYLPNVPYIMFFENENFPGFKGYSLHGTYWHNDFGNRRSHGCVNLPTPIAEQLYYWTTPVLAEGKKIVRSSGDNPGTRIVIHE